MIRERYAAGMGTEPTTTETIDADPTDDAATDPSDGSREAEAPGRSWAIAITLMAGLVVGVVLATQVLLLNSLNDAKSEISSLQNQVDAVGESVDTLAEEVEGVAGAVSEVAASPIAGDGTSQVEAPSESLPAGFLPRFDKNQPDAARGMTLGAISGIDGYTEEVVSVDPADGTRRIWMVWAHWCPFCQQELPLLSDWYPTIEDEYDTEMVTVSTNIDPSRGNPLPQYLADEQFPFTVVVDPQSQLAVQMGVSAFPFWVITDGDGEVLLRTTGLLQVQQVQNLLDQVENLGT